ncbi:MAG: FliH/SctL family protein [Novosphingobium sp.]
MSDPVRAVSLSDLARGGVGGGFTRDHRFNRGQSPIFGAADSGGQLLDEAVDPAVQAFAAGYAQGAADAEAAFSEAIAQQDATRTRIELAFGRLDADLTRDLEVQLRDTVLALCGPLLGDFAADPVALARRVETAAAMLARAADERVIRLHPEDLALVGARLPEDWHFEPDPALERGALRIEGAAGGVEDSPAGWTQALKEALGLC